MTEFENDHENETEKYYSGSTLKSQRRWRGRARDAKRRRAYEAGKDSATSDPKSSIFRPRSQYTKRKTAPWKGIVKRRQRTGDERKQGDG